MRMPPRRLGSGLRRGEAVIRFLLNPEVREIWHQHDDRRLLLAYEQVWSRKSILARLYETWYLMILDELRPGSILEVCAGTGNFQRWLGVRGRRSWTLDILAGHHIDIRADALHMPFLPGSLDNIVLIDALHHLARPFQFLQQAKQLLASGGRVLLVEPYASVWGGLVYRYMHHERVDFRFEESESGKPAWDGNAAIPRLVLEEGNRKRLGLRVARVEYCEFLSYPLSGGFSYRCLLPPFVLLGLHRLEQLRLFRNRKLSLRVFAVLEKS
jgi:SAM-dependent methyltransferase